MRVIEEVCKRRHNCHFLLEGGDDVSYGANPKANQSYREKMLGEVEIDSSRVHFLGVVPFATHVQLLQVSSVHVYLTVPFVLSWSMLEAMSAECLIIGSQTPPVQEIIRDGQNGLLVDFFSHKEIADLIDEVFAHPTRMQLLREQARRDIVERYDVKIALKQYTQLCGRIINGTQSK